MEYSELVEAIGENNTSKVNKLLKTLTPRLIGFLRVHMNAEKKDAEDCAQQTLLRALESIKKGSIRNSDQIVSFLLTTCRNIYLNMIRKKDQQQSYDEYPEQFGNRPRQLLSILDEERRKLLEWCREQLSDDYRQFIDYWFKYPDSEASAVATHFDISVSNAWTRKHRIIKKLNECYEEKSAL